MPVIDAGDRVHVQTPRFVWTLLKGFGGGRGPGYISDVRERRRPWRQLVSDGGAAGHTINDPRAGGLFGFGLIAALPDSPPDPGSFWNWAWEVTDRLAGPNFGVTSARVEVDAGGVLAEHDLRVMGRRVAHVQRRYSVGPGDRVNVETRVVPFPQPGLWIKEPKLVVNGLHGYRALDVADRAGARLGRFDLTKKGDPRKSTFQIAHPDRYAYTFSAPDRPALHVKSDGLTAWVAEAQGREPLSRNAIRLDGSFGPQGAYCLDGGKLWARTECPRWGGDVDVAGLALHGWEGGYGAPDCWATFRPWPTVPLLIRSSVELT